MTERRRGWPRRVVVCAVAGLATGCGGSDVASGPINTTAIDTIVGDHLPEPDRVDHYWDDERDTVGADYYYGERSVDVRVGSAGDTPAAESCDEPWLECDVLDTDVDDAVLTLEWQEEEPEEDPGIIVLLLEREGETSTLAWGGDVVVTGDPRDLDLVVSVDDAVDLLEDDRLRLDVP